MSGLEAAANILALIGAAQDVSRLTVKLLKRFKHAPAEFSVLLEEVENMQLVLSRVEKTHEALEKSPSDLERLIQAAERKMLAVNKLIQDKFTKPGKAVKVDRVAWVMHSRKAKQLVTELGSLRRSIVDVLSALNCMNSVSLCLEVQKLSLSQSTAFSDVLHQQEQFMNLFLQRLEESPATQNRLQEVAKKHVHQGRPSRFSPSPRPGIGCSKTCRCACHKKRQFCSPSSVRFLVGRLSVSHPNVSWLRPRCTIDTCKGSTETSVAVQYILPTWLANTMLMCYLKSTPLSGPEFLLKVGRTTDSEIFDRVMKGDIESVRSMYLSGTVSIHDVDPIFHQNTLIWAFRYARYDLVRLLCEYGADPSQTDIFKLSGNDYAFMKTLAKRIPDDVVSMFDIDGLLLETELTTLHQSVIGLTTHSVEKELEEHPELADTFDAKGRTALFWAVLSDNFAAAKTLLAKQMADTTVVAADGGSGFGVCAEFASPEMARLLLSGQGGLKNKEKDMHRWRSNAGDNTGRASPWMAAIQDSSDEFFRLCTRWKDQWDARDTLGRNLLHHTVTYGYWGIAEMFMLPDFAIIDPWTKDRHGVTAYDIFWWRFPDYKPPPEREIEDPEIARTAGGDWRVGSRDRRSNSLDSDYQTSETNDDDTRDSASTLVGGLDTYEQKESDKELLDSEENREEAVGPADFRDRTYLCSPEALRDADAIWRLLKYVERTRAERDADANIKTNIPGAWIEEENEEG